MRTIVALTREGLIRAGTAPRLILLVWLLHLVLAVLAALPLWYSLRSVLGPLPEGDVLRTGIRLGALADLVEIRPGLPAVLGSTLAGVAVAGLLAGAAIAGGVLETLHSGDGRPLGHRFGRGAGRFFGRFVALSLIVGLLMAIVGALAVAPFVRMARSYFEEGWEPGRLAPLGGVAVVGLVALLASLVLDASRLHAVRSDAGAFSSLGAGLGLVVRHPLLWAGTWLANGVLVGLAVAVFALFRSAVPTDRGVLIFAMVLAQQTLALVRTGLRVALLASESALVARLRPSGRADGAAAVSSFPQAESSSAPGVV